MKNLGLILGIAALGLCACGGDTTHPNNTLDASVSTIDSDLGPDQDALMCGSTQHICSNACVSDSAVATCGTTSCTPCTAPTNGTATCNGTACGFTCNAGFMVSGSTCVTASHLYIASDNTAKVVMCPFTSTGLGACTDSGNTGVAFGSPLGVTANAAVTRAYVANFSTNAGVSVCPLNPDRSFGACVSSGQTFTPAPLSVVLNAAGTFAYVVQNTSVSVCTIATDGTFSSCADAGAGTNLAFAQGLALNSAGTYLYMVLSSSAAVRYCAVSSTTGLLSACANAGNVGETTGGLSLISLDASGAHAYLPDTGSHVTVCPINSNGSFGTCVDSGATIGSSVTLKQVAFYNGNAYVSIEDTSKIEVCAVNSTTGLFSNCADSGATGTAFSGPWGVAIF